MEAYEDVLPESSERQATFMDAALHVRQMPVEDEDV
jgi:hypothetical protein